MIAVLCVVVVGVLFFLLFASDNYREWKRERAERRVYRQADATSRWRTVAMCDRCWREREGEREPHRRVPPKREVCHRCGCLTDSGIYVGAEVTE